MTIQIYVKRVGVLGIIKVIDPDELSDYCKFELNAGSDHSMLPIRCRDGGMVGFFVDEFGINKGLPTNFRVGNYNFAGTAIFYKANSHGETASLSNDDIALIRATIGDFGANRRNPDEKIQSLRRRASAGDLEARLKLMVQARRDNGSVWTRLHDQRTGDLPNPLKLSPYQNILIEAPEKLAIQIFRNKFGVEPERATCRCCGADYSIIDGYSTLAEATAYERNSKLDGSETQRLGPTGEKFPLYISLGDYLKRRDVLVIRIEDLQPSDLAD